MTRPGILVVVAGVGTDIGKTWVAAGVIRGLRARGHRVAARKPAQSFDEGDDTRGITDAHLLAEATGEDPTDVCPAERWYPVPMAPPMAAEVLGRPAPRLADLLAELTFGEPPADVGIVETAGGVRSPLADDADTVDLCRSLEPDVVVLVADAGLGTIHLVRSSVQCLGGAGRVVVHLNRFDPSLDLHRRNARWLADRDALAVTFDVDDLVDLLAAGSAPDRLPSD